VEEGRQMRARRFQGRWGGRAVHREVAEFVVAVGPRL